MNKLYDTLPDLLALNAIPKLHRYVGMEVTVLDTDGYGTKKKYTLVGGTADSNWQEGNIGGALPVASPTVLGGIKIGTGLSIDEDGIVSAGPAPGGGGGLTGTWDMSVSGEVSCAYPLGASEAEVMSFGLTGRLALSNNDQTGTYTADGASRTFGAFPTNPSSPATLDFSTDIKVVEFAFRPTALVSDGGSGGDKVDLNAYISTTTGVTIVGGRVRCNNNGTFDVYIFRGASTVATVNNIAPDGNGNIIIGFEMNCDAGTYEAVVQGALIGVSNDTFTPQSAILIFTTSETAVAEIDIGKTFSTTARTDAADITQEYSLGATSACSNALGTGEASLPVGAAAGDIYEVTVAGYYGGTSFSVGDLAFLRADEISVTKIPATAGVTAAQLAAAVSAHAAAEDDPHGDRAYANSVVANEAFTREGTDTLLDGRIAALENGSKGFAGVITHTTATRTLAASDSGQYIRVDYAGTCNVTVPHDSAVNFPIGTEIHVMQAGAKQVAITAMSGYGTTINGGAGTTVIIAGQYKAVTLKKVAANAWDCFGGLA